jgi:hypothetical protein
LPTPPRTPERVSHLVLVGGFAVGRGHIAPKTSARQGGH